MSSEDAILHQNRLSRALEDVARQGRENFLRLIGESDPEIARRRKRAAQLADPIRPKRQSGTWIPGQPPTGAEWFYARWCALQCVHLWAAPKIVRDYLEGGDPHLASATPEELRRAEFWGTGIHRVSAASEASTYCMLATNRPNDHVAICAAWSAMFAASGNITGAADWAIHALVADALRKVRSESQDELSQDDCLAVTSAARAKLQTIFADAAREIYEGENHA